MNGACNPTFFGTPLSASNYSASNSRYQVKVFLEIVIYTKTLCLKYKKYIFKKKLF